MRIQSFEPIVGDSCRVLVLGTMPGPASLRKQQYYGYDRNAFWRIIYNLFGEEPEEEYELRKSFLLKHNIALWDVLKSCEREGSSDSDIRNPVPNDFAGLYLKFPNIKYVCFNGRPAGNFYRRLVEKTVRDSMGKACFYLASTSPAYTLPYEKKLEEWRLLLELLK
ncbi:MAG: DNA-deoxyinosine glycosylase [Bacillota bacterium]